MTPVWLEVHVDDVLLAKDPARWPEAAKLVDTIARAAEAEGGRLSFRVRARFAEGDRGQFLVDLVNRGHEVGAHAHGKDLAAGVAALRRAGITPTVFAPGFVQVGLRGWRRLAEQARALGCTRLTDRVEAKLWTYQGWLGWSPIPGVTATDVSVSPLDWGVVVKDGRRYGPGRPDWAKLAAMARVQTAWEAPPHASPFFGATVHEHDLAEPGTLRPVNLDGLRRYVAEFQPIRSGDVPVELDPVDVPRRSIRDAVRFRLRTHRRTTERVGSIEIRRVGPPTPRGAIVVVHGGGPGTTQALAPFGLDDDALDGIAVWTFDRSAGERTPGNPVHIAEARAVFDRAAAEGVPTGFLTWSAGVIPALRSGAPAAFLVDAEGPADRFSLVPPGQPGHELATARVFDEAPWAGREAVELIRGWRAPYTRLQGTHDHQHGAMVLHARRMVAAAPDGRLALYPGRLHAHGAAIRALLLAQFG